MLTVEASVLDQAKNVVLCRPQGSIDATTAPSLKGVITNFIAGGRNHLVMDFGQVDYISSAGWGVILGRLREFRDIGGDIYIVDMRPAVSSVFKLMGLDTVIRYYDTVSELGANLGFQIAEAPIPVVREEARIETPTPLPSRPLSEVLPEIVKDHPSWGARQISQELRRVRPGEKQLGAFRVFRELSRLGLGSERRRLYFAFREMKRERNETKPRP